jgi:hypothetical protein
MGTACRLNGGHSKTGIKEIVLETVILTHRTQLLTIMSQVNPPPIFKHFIANTSHTVDLPSPSRPFKLTLSKSSAGLRIPCLPHLIPWHCSVLRRSVCVLFPTNHLNNLQQVTRSLTSDAKFDNSSRPIGPSDHDPEGKEITKKELTASCEAAVSWVAWAVRSAAQQWAQRVADVAPDDSL